MKATVTTTASAKSDTLAKDFYAHMVDGGIEDQLLQALFGHQDKVELSDSEIQDLVLLFQRGKEFSKRTVRKKGIK